MKVKDPKKQSRKPKRSHLDKDDLWIINHFSHLIKKYPGKYVAVINESVSAVGNSPSEVEVEAKRKVPEKMPSVILVPREEELACLL